MARARGEVVSCMTQSRNLNTVKNSLWLGIYWLDSLRSAFPISCSCVHEL